MNITERTLAEIYQMEDIESMREYLSDKQIEHMKELWEKMQTTD